MSTITLKYRKQEITAVLRPERSVWDAFQTVTTADKRGDQRGRGDFEVGDFRIFAENQTVAKMLARRLETQS